MALLILAVQTLLASASALAVEALVWDFESEQITWRPRADTIAVVRVAGQSATADSRACLAVRGEIDVGWNYAISDSRPMQAGQLYRLSAWVRVLRVGPGTPMPFLKCEFIPAEPNQTLGRAATGAYDARQMGQWQRLVAEFRAPEGTVRCWLALEKGGEGAMEIDAQLDDVVVEPIARLSVFDQYRLEPVPAPLAAVRGVHPRIYLDQRRVAILREAIASTHASLWEEVKALADRAVGRGAPKYVERDSYSGDEQLWQRGVGDTMPMLAMAYLMTGEQKYLASAREWALASCGYKTWGLGRTDGMDLAAGHQLFGLGIVYDWCYGGLGQDARQTIRETIQRRASAMFEAAATDKAWWRRSYLQNHLWVNVCGLAIAGLAVYDEVEGADEWVGLALDKFKATMAALGDDGASHEGVGYWGYGVEYMLKFMHVARELLDVDLYDHDWWRNTATYRQYLALPRNAWTPSNCIVDIADCPRGNWYGPDYLLRALAREYGDGYAQWLAQQIDESNVDSSAARWLNLVWFDLAVEPKPPTDRPRLHHFPDMDIVSARSDWSGDESLVVFKCGPFIGHKAVQEFDYDPGGGHVHPDANHFVLFGAGEWLIRDDGYRGKWTGQHNTLLIDGKGQLGEGRMWFNGGEALAVKARPRIVRAESTPVFDHIVGDATEAYPRETGLQRYIRHLLFLKPNVLIVVDDIGLDKAKPLELRFHPEQPQAEVQGQGFILRGKAAVLRVEPLTPDGVSVMAENVAAADRHGAQSESMFTIRLRTHGASWRNAVALSWSAEGRAPERVTMKQEDQAWAFAAAGHELALDWGDGRARLVR